MKNPTDTDLLNTFLANGRSLSLDVGGQEMTVTRVDDGADFGRMVRVILETMCSDEYEEKLLRMALEKEGS